MRFICMQLDDTLASARSVNNRLYLERGIEPWAKAILDDIRYTGKVSIRPMIKLLRHEDSVGSMIGSIIANVVTQRLSLEGDPKDSLLPFTPEIHLWLRGFYKSLRGMKCKFPKRTCIIAWLICCQKYLPRF